MDGPANWLALAATPAFSTMALITASHVGGHADVFCSAAHDSSPLGGMTLMYLLMSAFHAPPWVRLFGNRSAG
jgi:hypothetical protein